MTEEHPTQIGDNKVIATIKPPLSIFKKFKNMWG